MRQIGELPAWPDLVLTDVVMPGINGRELAATLLAKRPDTRVLFTSGYLDGRAAEPPSATTQEAGQVLEKPYTAATLLRRVRERLERVP